MRDNAARVGIGERMARGVAEARGIVYVLVLALAVLSLAAVGRTDLKSGITSYLPKTSNAGGGEALIAEEFTQLARADVFLENVSVSQCETVRQALSAVDGVFSANFDSGDYDLGRALIRVTMTDPGAVKAVGEIVSGYDGYVVTDGSSGWGITGSGFNMGAAALAVASCAVFVISLIFASRSWGDIFVIFVTTLAAVILNLGTSFVSGSVSRLTMVSSGIAQAALTMYYSAGVCRRYARERRTLAPAEAAAAAVSHSMPRTLTMALASAAAMGGLCFAANGLGREFGLTVIKGIVISVIMTAVLTPCLIVSRSKKLDGSKHKSYLPKVEKRGKFTVNTKTLFPVLFCLALILTVIITGVSTVKPYAYFDRLTDLVPLFKTQTQLTAQRIEKLFTGSARDVYLLVPSGDYDKQQALTMELEKLDRVIEITGLTTVDAAGYHPADRITSSQLAEITGLDQTAAAEIFDACGAADGSAPFIDVFMYAYDSLKNGSPGAAKDAEARMEDVYRQLWVWDLEYHGENYDKIKITMKVPIGTTAALEAVNRIRELAESKYGDTVYLTGDAGGIVDTHQTFSRDRLVIFCAAAALLLIALTVILRRPGQAAVVTFVTVGGCALTTAIPYLNPCRVLFTGPMLGWGVTMAALGAWGAVTAAAYNKYKVGVTLRRGIGKSLKENYTLVTVSGGLTILLGIALMLFGFSAGAMYLGMFMAIGGTLGLILALCVIPQSLVLWDVIVGKITHTPVDLANDKYRDDDIVAAFEQLKTDIDDMRKGDER